MKLNYFCVLTFPNCRLLFTIIIGLACLLGLYYRLAGFPRSWKIMENKKNKSRPGKVMKNDNFMKRHEKVMDFS